MGRWRSRICARGLFIAVVLGAASCGGTRPGAGPDADPGEPAPPDPPPEENGIDLPAFPVTLPATLEIGEGLALAVPVSGTFTKQIRVSKPPSQSTTTTSAVSGKLQLVTPAYTFTLASAALTIVSRDGVTKSVSGTAQVVMPALHTFSGLGAGNSPLSASFGYDRGSNLGSLEMPLDPDRRYLYFTSTVGFKGSFGFGPFSVSRNKTATIIVDPLDPAIFVGGPMGDISAIALSERSLIPFSAETTWGFETPEEEFPAFGGQSYVAGNVPLEEFPVTVDGNVTTRYVQWDGITAFDKIRFDRTVGVNGNFNLGWQALDGTFSFTIPVAKASLYVEASLNPIHGVAAFSGTAKVDTFLPPWVPVALSNNAQMAGYMDTMDVGKNHIDGATGLTIGASTLGKTIGLDMKDVTIAKGSFHVDRMGFRFNGRAKLDIPPLLASNAKITACFGGDPVACLSDDQAGHPLMGSRDWLLRAEGRVNIAGVPLAGMTAMARPAGMEIEATLETQKQKVVMKGSIATRNRIQLGGQAPVNFRLNAGNEVLKAIVSGAICGYKYVTDAAICGEKVFDYADEFHCGKPHCSWSWRHGLRCSGLSCSVTLPKSCNDLSKPKKCSPPNSADFDLGRVDGMVALRITNGGIDGDLSGTFCPAGGGQCVSLANIGKLDFSTISAPEICINSSDIGSTLPAGKFCVEF
jgi:hypothetical protein